MPGLGALGDLDLDHLDLGQRSSLAEGLGVEVAVSVAAAEVAGADLPDQVAARLLVVLRQAALAGVVGEPTGLRTLVHRPDGGLAQSPEAHRRDVQHRRRVGLRALLAADDDPEVLLRVGDHRPGRDGVVHPAVAGVVHVELGAERLLVAHVLGALVDHRAGVPVERAAVGVVLHQVLVQLGAHALEEEPHPPGQRVVAQDAVPLLEVVVDAQRARAARTGSPGATTTGSPARTSGITRRARTMTAHRALVRMRSIIGVLLGRTGWATATAWPRSDQSKTWPCS